MVQATKVVEAALPSQEASRSDRDGAITTTSVEMGDVSSSVCRPELSVVGGDGFQSTDASQHLTVYEGGYAGK